MRMRRPSSLSLIALACLAQPLAAAADSNEPTPEYKAEKAQLEEMLSKRDLEIYELQFIPGRLGRVTLVDRTGRDRVFNYLTFRIRNAVTADSTVLAAKAKGYNEVLESITKQYERAKVESADGVRLRIDGVEGQDGVILERTDAKPKTRSVSLTAMAFDENGTRIRLLDEPPGSGVQEQYAFPDLGDTRWESVVQRVKERVEEAEGGKLLTTDQIAKLKLPPFDGIARVEVANIEDPLYDMKGWYVGEAHGVLLFHHLSDHGDRFTIKIHGLSNKLRFRAPAAEPGKPENYFTTKVMRRTMMLSYVRPGDEFHRDLDAFTLVEHGYRWDDRFVDVAARQTIAYARYFLDNIADDKGNVNVTVRDLFWPYYDEQRAAHSGLPDLKPQSGP